MRHAVQGWVSLSGAELHLEVEAATPLPEGEVEYQTGRPVPQGMRKEGLRRRKGLGGKVYRVEKPAQRSAHMYVVVDDVHHAISHSVGTYRDIRRRATGVPRPPGPGENRDVLPPYAPMIPPQVRRPFHREGWIYEEKIDDWRMLAYKDGRTVRLENRDGVNDTRRRSRPWSSAPRRLAVKAARASNATAKA
jgi:hypothetical protein